MATKLPRAYFEATIAGGAIASSKTHGCKIEYDTDHLKVTLDEAIDGVDCGVDLQVFNTNAAYLLANVDTVTSDTVKTIYTGTKTDALGDATQVSGAFEKLPASDHDAWVTFTVNGGAISTQKGHKAVAAYTGVGVYTITLDEAMAAANCRMKAYAFNTAGALVMCNVRNTATLTSKIVYVGTATAVAADCTKVVVVFDKLSPA